MTYVINYLKCRSRVWKGASAIARRCALFFCISMSYGNERDTENNPVQVERTTPNAPLYIDENRQLSPPMYVESDIDVLNRAWSELGFENYPLACQLFEQASNALSGTVSTISLSAMDGWAECLQQQHRYEDAAKKLQYLISRQYRLLATYPRLITNLERAQLWSLADFYRQSYVQAQQAFGLEHAQQRLIDQAFANAIRLQNLNVLTSLIEQHQPALDQCQLTTNYLSAIEYLHRLNEPALIEKALQVLYSMLKGCPQKWVLRVSVFQWLAKLESVTHLETLITEEQQRWTLPAQYHAQLVQILLNKMKAEFFNLPSVTREETVTAVTLGEKILSYQDNDWSVVSVLAWHQYHLQQYERSLHLFNTLINVYPHTLEYSQGKYFNLMKLARYQQAQMLAKRKGLKKEWLASLESQLEAASSDEQPPIAQQILKLQPSHPWSLEIMAWHYFKTQQTQKSADLFKRLWQAKPSESGLNGWLLSLQKNRQWSNMSPLIKSPLLNKQTRQHWLEIQQDGLLELAFNQQAFQKVIDGLKTVSKMSVQHWEWLAWSRFYLGQTEQALKDFSRGFTLTTSPQLAKSILTLFTKTRRDAEKRAFAIELLSLADSAGDSALASALYEVAAAALEIDLPQLTAQYPLVVDGSPDRTLNWHHPSLEYHYRRTEQTGDVGKSRLHRQIHSLWINGPWLKHWRASLVAHRETLHAGEQPTPDVGSDYLAGTTLNSIVTDDWDQQYWHVLTPQVRVHRQGPDYQVHSIVGMTPLAGPVESAIAGRLSVRTERKEIELYRVPRVDSQLAYIGMRDPYRDRPWGRVLESGVSAAQTWPITDRWWFKGKLQASQLGGTFVKENSHRSAGLSGGIFDSLEWFDLTAGVYADTFRHAFDSDFYTAGQGGVYSPSRGANVGVFTDLESHQHSPTWWRFEASLGGYAVRSEAVDRFPQVDEVGEYASSESQGWSFRLGCQGQHLGWRRLKLYGQCEWNRAGGFQYWQTQVGIEWFFWAQRPRIGLPLPPMDIWQARWPERL